MGYTYHLSLTIAELGAIASITGLIGFGSSLAMLISDLADSLGATGLEIRHMGEGMAKVVAICVYQKFGQTQKRGTKWFHRRIILLFLFGHHFTSFGSQLHNIPTLSKVLSSL